LTATLKSEILGLSRRSSAGSCQWPTLVPSRVGDAPDVVAGGMRCGRIRWQSVVRRRSQGSLLFRGETASPTAGRRW
jgi:hypothetical protein